MKDLVLSMPSDASAQVNYLFALASCENYQIPTLPQVNVQELIGQKIFSWYQDILFLRSHDEVAWFSNYE
jgi:hypothetical protein